MIKNLTVFALTIGLGVSSLTAQSSIEQVAPENTIMLFGVDNVSRSIERFKRTPMHALWNSPEMREVRRDMAREMEGEVMVFLREMGLEEDDAWFPTGGGGLAMFTVVDPETGAVSPAIIAFADYGASADQMDRVIQNFLERREREGEIEYEEKEILGRTVYSITKLDDDDDFDMDDFDMDDFDFDFDPMGGIGDFSMDTFHYVRNGSALMICSDLGSLTETMDRLDNGGNSALADRADYKAIIDRVGARDAHFVLLTRDLMQIIAASDPMGMATMAGPIAKSVFGDIKGFGTSVQLDGPQAMFEQNYFVSMPNGKAGLTKLIDAPAARESLPPYVGVDAIGFTSFAFQFSRVAEVAREIVRANPMIGMMAGEVMEIIEGPVHDVFSALGNRVQHVQTLTRPITIESMSQLFAIEVRRPQELENQIAMWAPQAGLEARDFLGHRIYSAPGMAMGMGMMEMALGLGGGFLFAGSEQDVQQGLRSTADRDRPGALANDPDYRRAIALLPAGPVVMWGYSDLVSSIELGMSMGPLAQQEMLEHWRREHPEIAEEMEGLHEDDNPFEKISPELLRRYIGPVSWQVQSTDDGFIGQAFLIGAE